MHSYQYRNEQSQKKNRRPHQVSELAEERDPTISPNNHSGKSPPCVYFICLGLGSTSYSANEPWTGSSGAVESPVTRGDNISEAQNTTIPPQQRLG